MRISSSVWSNRGYIGRKKEVPRMGKSEKDAAESASKKERQGRRESQSGGPGPRICI